MLQIDKADLRRSSNLSVAVRWQVGRDFIEIPFGGMFLDVQHSDEISVVR